jgi:DNA-binding NarL/FixJ family response regulator
VGEGEAHIRVLLVDDFEPWRRLVASMLEQMPGVRVVGEVADGLAAIQKAEELQPDLILLDIGLPKMNGIEAARQIDRCAPHSKVLFLSQESSPDVVHELLSTGAWGYVLKSHAHGDLPVALETFLRGGFSVNVGSELVGCDSEKAPV